MLLSTLEKCLREDYFNILKLEEDFWALKSRVGWVVDENKNTKFFHTSTLVCRRFNKIVSLRNNVGKWITDSVRICHHIQQGFIDLFSTSHSSSLSGTNLPLKALKIFDTEAFSLMDPINANDVFFLFTLPPLEPV